MLDAVTDRDAGSIAGPHPGKPSAKTWAASLIGLGLVAGGVIAGPRLLSSSTPPAVIRRPASPSASRFVARSTAGSRSSASSRPSSRSNYAPRSAAR